MFKIVTEAGTVTMTFDNVSGAFDWYYDNMGDCALVGIFHASYNDIISMV